MTKQLYDISTNNANQFLGSLEKVENFAKKILILTEGDKDKMKALVNHSRKGTSFKTDQNFYYLWLLLKI